jgi:hypothetical protein
VWHAAGLSAQTWIDNLIIIPGILVWLSAENDNIDASVERASLFSAVAGDGMKFGVSGGGQAHRRKAVL